MFLFDSNFKKIIPTPILFTSYYSTVNPIMMKTYSFVLSILCFLNTSKAQPTVTIQLNGANTILHEVNTPYEDAGFSALDSANNDYSQFVQIAGIVDTTTLGVYSLGFSLPTQIAVSASQMRLVQVVDRTAPSIELLGRNPVSMFNHSPYEDEGIKITDNYYSESLLNSLVSVSVSPGLSINGSTIEFTSDNVLTGTIHYFVTDPSGNTSDTATRILTRYFTSLNELSKASILIYPNPVTDELHIKSTNTIHACFLINPLGQRIPLRLEKDGTGVKAKIANIQSGIYILFWEMDGTIQSANIMISR
jgi:hypothetical protein